MRQLWNDDNGTIIQAELIFVVAILLIGTMTALVTLRQTIIGEAAEVVRMP